MGLSLLLIHNPISIIPVAQEMGNVIQREDVSKLYFSRKCLRVAITWNDMYK